MPDTPENRLTLRQADQARAHFRHIETELDAIHARLASMPARADLARKALGMSFDITGLFFQWDQGFVAPRSGMRIDLTNEEADREPVSDPR